MLTKKISSVRYPKSYKVGTGPFCSASDADCMPGYVFKNKHDKGCWTGIKGECVFDVDEYKRTGTYARIAEEKGKKFADENIPSAYFVYGTAPICGGSFCDVVKDNKFPIGMTESGGGSKCLTGSKAIGIEPVAKFQFDLIEKWKSECREDENKARDMWIEGFKTANKAMGAITGSGGIEGALAEGLKTLEHMAEANLNEYIGKKRPAENELIKSEIKETPVPEVKNFDLREFIKPKVDAPKPTSDGYLNYKYDEKPKKGRTKEKRTGKINN
jgi:hypothetical protein